MTFLNYFIMGAGVFTIMGAALDLDWFMTHRRASLFVQVLGRLGARALYCLLGAMMLVIGAVIREG